MAHVRIDVRVVGADLDAFQIAFGPETVTINRSEVANISSSDLLRCFSFNACDKAGIDVLTATQAQLAAAIDANNVKL